MGLKAALEANAEFAEGGKPGMRTLNDPAMPAESIVALDASASNPILDAAALEVFPATRIVIAFVRVQLVRQAPGPATSARNRGQRIDQLLEDHRVMPVGAGDTEHQRDALPVRDEVALTAELATVRRVGAGVRAPRGLGTVDPSTLARLRSSWPAPRSSARSIRCRRCQTPAACQSRSLRQHVMPLPKPSSWGRSSQAMPVRSTKRTPLSARSSSSLGRPPLSDGLTSGSNGLILFHSAALTSLFLFMHRQTQFDRFAMTTFC
jgi:hypothetical protein